MRSDFYRAFEERHRGSRDQIKNRLRFYLPFVDALRCQRQDLLVADLGCGRGEWLELLREQGLSGLGVDLDDQMLAACRERDLRVETADALAWLADQPDESCDIVSAFHLVEHLPFDSLEQLVGHGLRVLRPAGLLILETPNPENIVVGTANFYLDPTHQRPLPPPLLAFLPEFHGFARTKIVRLQESIELASGRAPTLFDVLGGASPDYAVIAQKQGEGENLATFTTLFERDYGVKTDTLAWRYEQAHQQSLREAFALARQAVEKCDTLLVRQQEQTLALQQQLAAVYASSSWRLTEPLRRLTTSFRSLSGAMSIQLRKTSHHLWLFVKRLTRRYPALGTLLRAAVSPFPRLEARIRSFVARKPAESVSWSALENCRDNKGIALTPAARRVYADLQAAIEESMSKDHP